MTPDRLSDADALIWHIQSDPVLRSPILAVALLDRMPAWKRVQASMTLAVAAIPRLRQRLEGGSFGNRPRWVDDDTFSLDHHVRHVRAATPNGLRAVLDLAEPDVMTAFDPARPLWQLTVVDGLAGGQAALVLRFHHTISDGVGAVALAEQIFDRARRGRPAVADVDASRDIGTPVVPGPVDWITAAIVGAVRLGLDPLGAARTGINTARSVAKMVAPAKEPLSPILLGRGLDRRLHVVEAPLVGLRDAARACDGTINDVFLAAVGGALRAYHEALGSNLDAMRVTMPINLRREGDAPGGNRFTPARFVLPVDDPDPVRRAELAGAIVRSWRAEPAVGLTPRLAWLFERLPPALIQRAFAGMLRSMDVDVVDVPGLQAPAYFAGAEVERLWAFAPPTGAAMSITLVSHQDTACIGLAADRAAVEDPDLLAACLERAVDEVLALAPGGSRSEVPA